MEAAELSNSLNIVFEKEMQDLFSGHQTVAVNESKGEYVILYQHAETLIQMYLTIRNNPKLKGFFVDTLKEGIVNSDGPLFLPFRTYLGISCLCFYTLVNIGCVNEAIASLKKRKKERMRRTF